MEIATSPAISLHAVTKQYGAVRAVDGLDLEIARGRTVALLGPNGAGKSTTVGMLMGLTSPDAGEVRVGGRSPRAAVTAGGIAAMLQDCGLMPGVTIGELIELGRRCYPHPLAVGRALELAGLSGLERRRIDRLSGGQIQRAKFALVAVADPEVMLLDEPTRALDVQGRREFWAAMRAYAATGRTVVFATHYLDEVEENADRVVMMKRGRIVADGTPAEIRAEAGGATVRFRVDGPGIVTDQLLRHRLPITGGVTIEDEWVTVRTTDADAFVRSLVRDGGDHGGDRGGDQGGDRDNATFPWRDLSVLPPSLDDSFLLLTGD
jgi:ABC-2 type transport system ATP-binding protein